MLPRGRSVCAAMCVAAALRATAFTPEIFDHDWTALADLLRAHVRAPRVDYASLVRDRVRLDAVVSALNSPTARDEARWTREQRMAFWINAYNVLTLRAIVDHYPIRSRWFTRAPRNSIRQIDGVWTTLTWNAAGRRVTLDDIEHRILRPVFVDARVHFALNCASVSCPPLADEPYRASSLEEQLDAAARRYLSSAMGLRLTKDGFQVSSLFKWYGDDFILAYAPLTRAPGSLSERAILGAIGSYAPAAAAGRARTKGGPIAYLDYDWSLNDVVR